MNTRLLRKVAKHISEEPHRLAMAFELRFGAELADHLDGYDSATEEVILNPPCNTAACIAGWTVLLGHPEVKPETIQSRFNVNDEAQTLLKIDDAAMDRLYYTSHWPKRFYDRFKTTNIKTRAKVAVARIEHFIATKGKE